MSGEAVRLSSRQKARLLNHLGFGNPKGRFWFIGMEEHGCGCQADLEARADHWQEIDDLHRCHAMPPFNDDGWDSRTCLIPTWSRMIRLILCLKDDANWSNRESVRAYQRAHLGRLDGENFLTELLPLPAPNMATWPHTWCWDSRAECIKAIMATRIEQLRELYIHNVLLNPLPKYVLCYGKTYWEHFQCLFRDVKFEPAVNGTVLVGRKADSNIVLTPFLSYRAGFRYSIIPAIAEVLGQRTI